MLSLRSFATVFRQYPATRPRTTTKRETPKRRASLLLFFFLFLSPFPYVVTSTAEREGERRGDPGEKNRALRVSDERASAAPSRGRTRAARTLAPVSFGPRPSVPHPDERARDGPSVAAARKLCDSARRKAVSLTVRCFVRRTRAAVAAVVQGGRLEKGGTYVVRIPAAAPRRCRRTRARSRGNNGPSDVSTGVPTRGPTPFGSRGRVSSAPPRPRRSPSRPGRSGTRARRARARALDISRGLSKNFAPSPLAVRRRRRRHSGARARGPPPKPGET